MFWKRKIGSYCAFKVKNYYLKVRNKVESIAIKRCLSGRFNEKDIIFLTSSPRSGSTLLGNILNTIPGSCVLFEPLHLKHVPGLEDAGFKWRTYIPPDKKWVAGEQFFRTIFEGKVINAWTCKEMSLSEAKKAKTLIVKSVRANRLLPWLCQAFDIPKPILLIRHPCAVVASQMNYDFWRETERPETPDFLDGYPRFQSALEKTDGQVEFLAALWAMDQLPALLEQVPRPWNIVTYEEIILNPQKTLSRLARELKMAWNPVDALPVLKKPTSVVSRSGISGIEGWKRKLSDEDIQRILKTVRGFGLNFYSEEIEPDLDLLYGKDLSDEIRKFGKG